MIAHLDVSYWLKVAVLVVVGCGPLSVTANVPQNFGSVTLSVIGARGESRDQNGAVVYDVEPGQHFKVLVTTVGQAGVSARPTIAGLDSFQTLGTGQSSNMMSVNGRVTNTMRFEYQVAASDEGEFTLGPATTNHGTSQAVSIRVHQRTQEESDRDFERDYRRGVACQARLVADRETFFLGEDIPVTLDIYCWDPRVDVDRVQPQFEGFSVKEQPHTVSSIVVDNKPVRVVQKKYTLSTLWPGVKKIKPVSLVYTVPVQGADDDFPFGGFHGALLFGPTRSVQQVEARTNGLELTIKELPKSDRNADGIGSFSSLVLSLDKNIVASRTPVNLSLKVVGKGNFEQVSAPRLRLPKGLRSFPGTTESDVVKNDASGESEKRFTYVVQPLKEGAFKIPAQEFMFFDPVDAAYKTIKSQETTIIVEGDTTVDPASANPASAKASPDMMADSGVAADKTIQESASSKTASAAKNSATTSTKEFPAPVRARGYKVPWTLWTALAALLFLLGFLYQHIQSWFAWHKRNPKKALKLALKDLEKLDKNAADQLFGIAIEYFSLRFFGGDTTNLSLDSVELILEQINLPRGRRIEFMKFITSLAGIAFTSARAHTDGAALRAELKKWLIEIDAV